MAKGSIAKGNVINKIAHIFGNDFIGEYEKKVYVWADDGGERVQIALSLTCPKVPIEAPGGSSTMDHSDWNFEDMPVTAAKPIDKAAITADEEKKLADVAAMMERLGL